MDQINVTIISNVICMQKCKKKILNFVVKLCLIRQQASLEVYKHKYYCVQYISLDYKKFTQP